MITRGPGSAYFLSGTIYWTANVTICVMAPATAGVHVFACGTNWKIRTVAALARTPALTLAVGAQLVEDGACCGMGATAVADILNLVRIGSVGKNAESPEFHLLTNA